MEMDALAALAAALLAFLLYYNTLDAGFVYDDRRAILGNADLLSRTPWTVLFHNDFWGTPLTDSGTHGSYRPLCVLTYRLNHLLDGLQPRGYHLVNVLLHCSATVLLVRVARLLLPKKTSRVGSAISGLLFAAHPIHTEAVAGVVGRADLLACNFFFLALLTYAAHVTTRDGVGVGGKKPRHYQRVVGRYSKGVGCEDDGCSWRSWVFLVVAIVLALMAMLCKETGITVIGACFLYDYLYSSCQKKNQWRSLGVLLATLVIILATRLQFQTPEFSTADNPTAKEREFLTRTLTFFYLPAFNFWTLLFPNTLSFDWGMEAVPRITNLTDKRNILTVSFYFFLLQMVLKSWYSLKRHRPKEKTDCGVCISEMHSQRCRNNNNNNINGRNCVCYSKNNSNARVVLFSIALVVLPFLPATNLFFYVGFVVAERVLYIPSAGVCVLMGLGAVKVYSRRRGFLGAVLLVLVVFGVKTVMRNRDWRDEEALYRSGVEVNPPKAYGNLGSVLSTQGRLKEAEYAYRKALEHRPNMADVHYNLGILLQGKKDLEGAIHSFKTAIHFRPSLALAYVNLGAALMAAGRCQEAATVLRQGSKLDGVGLKNRREHESAKVSALLQLGALYSDQGRLQRALATYREAAYSLPENYPPQSVFNVLGETLAKLQQDNEAEKWYRAALDAQPDHVPAHITYGKLLAKNGSRTAEAEQWFLKAQRLAPEDPSVYHHYGEFLVSCHRFKEAAVLYEKAAELRPTDYDLVVAAATAMRQASRNDQAEKWYRRALALKPDDARSHTNMGAILHLNGKYREAAHSYKRALRMQPDDVTTLTNLHKLHSVMT